MGIASTPEEKELSSKIVVLEQLEDDLIQKELEFATLVAETTTFNSRYMHCVGRLYVRLDEIEGEIAERIASINSGDQTAINIASEARQRARDSAQALGDADLEPEVFKPSEELKQTFRQAAKRFHPDRALDEADREWRNNIMAEVNIAYKSNDIEKIERILNEAVSRPEGITGEDVVAKLIRAIRRISQVQIRVEVLSNEIESVKSSEIYALKLQVETEEKTGADPLGDLARQIKEEIALAEEKLKALLIPNVSRIKLVKGKEKLSIKKSDKSSNLTFDSFIVIDFETTGLSPSDGARATEVAAVLVKNGQISERYHSLMNAGVQIPQFIQDLTGITNAMIAKAPPCAEVMGKFIEFIGNAPLVAHNASFDKKFLDAELEKANLKSKQPMICSMKIAQRLYQRAPNHKLGTLVDYTGIKTNGVFHRALADAEKTAYLMLKMAGEIKDKYGMKQVSFSLMEKLQFLPKHEVHETLLKMAKTN